MIITVMTEFNTELMDVLEKGNPAILTEEDDTYVITNMELFHNELQIEVEMAYE